MARVWIARLAVSERTREKIATKHGLDVADLRAHLVAVAGLDYRIDHDPERGRRLVLVVRLLGRPVAVVLYPAPDLGDDAYRLGTRVPALACAVVTPHNDGVEEDTFYEDDEPIEKIRAILDRAPGGVTAPPTAWSR